MTLPSLTLRNKLLVFAALLVVLPGVMIGLIAERSGRDQLESMIGGQLAREAHQTADRIATRLRTEREILRSFAQQEVMREIRVGDIDKRISQALITLRDGNASRVDYLVTDVDGNIVAASSPDLIDHDPPWASDLLIQGVRAGTTKAPLPGPAGLVIATDVPDPDQAERVLGRLVGLLDWNLLTQITGAVNRDLHAHGIAAEIAMLAEDGSPLAPAFGDFSFGTLEGIPWRASEPQSGGLPDALVEPSLGAIVGRAPLSSVAPDDPLPDWTVLVAEPLDHAFAPVRELRNRIALAVSLALATALVLATFSARRVARPLAQLTAAIRALSRGDPAILRVPVRTQDEVGEVAAAFNHMASELDQVQRNLVEAEKFAFVGELASGVAHEVRTSLGVLRSSAQMLERSLPSGAGDEATELAGMIRHESDRLAGVVDDLLTLDRPRPLHLVSERVSAAVWRAVDFVESQAHANHIAVRRIENPEEVNVLCDSEMIYQVAVNLLVNAAQALGTGGSIDIEIQSPEDGYGGFSVTDDGAGVPDALRDKIFQPFVTARDGGIGLGLTFVKRVVHEHSGLISLEPAAAGRGACFRVQLPIMEPPC